MPNLQKVAVRSADLGKVMEVVSRVYCPHDVKVHGGNRGAPASFEVIRAGEQPIVALRYATPVTVETDFRGLMLIQSCVEGSATMTHGVARAVCRGGQTVPLSPGVDSVLRFDAAFSQRSVRIDVERLEALVARRAGSPLDRPLQFEFRTFSPDLEQAWSQAVSLLVGYEHSGIALPEAATSNLDEFLLTLLLEKHPHNYSDEIKGRARAIAPRLIREAEHLMKTGGVELSASQIAARLRVSLRSLEAGFHEWRQMTPTQALRKIRLEQVRKALLEGPRGTSVTQVALSHGFFHLPRFSAYYKAAFGELPGRSLQRNFG